MKRHRSFNAEQTNQRVRVIRAASGISVLRL